VESEGTKGRERVLGKVAEDERVFIAGKGLGWQMGSAPTPYQTRRAVRAVAARNRDHPATSAKTRFLQLGSRQIDHYTIVYKSLLGVYLTGVHLTGVYLIGVCLMGVYLMDVHLIGMCLMGVHLTGMHLIGIHFMGMHLIGVHLTGICLLSVYLIDVISRACIS
jgi:hypothetical protein